MRLIYAALPCNQVEDFNKGTGSWETFDKFVTVSVMRLGPGFTKLDISKEQYISAVSSAGKEDPNYLFDTSNALYLLMKKPNMHVVSAFTYAKGVPLNISNTGSTTFRLAELVEPVQSLVKSIAAEN
jgi:hypothetical protein